MSVPILLKREKLLLLLWRVYNTALSLKDPLPTAFLHPESVLQTARHACSQGTRKHRTGAFRMARQGVGASVGLSRTLPVTMVCAIARARVGHSVGVGVSWQRRVSVYAHRGWRRHGVGARVHGDAMRLQTQGMRGELHCSTTIQNGDKCEATVQKARESGIKRHTRQRA